MTSVSSEQLLGDEGGAAGLGNVENFAVKHGDNLSSLRIAAGSASRMAVVKIFGSFIFRYLFDPYDRLLDVKNFLLSVLLPTPCDTHMFPPLLMCRQKKTTVGSSRPWSL